MIMFKNNVLPYALGLGIIAICIVFGSTDDKKYTLVFTSITIKYIDKIYFEFAEAYLTEVDPDNPDDVGANVTFSLIKELSAKFDTLVRIYDSDSFGPLGKDNSFVPINSWMEVEDKTQDDNNLRKREHARDSHYLYPECHSPDDIKNYFCTQTWRQIDGSTR
uniref:Uncharacterized protein n=1 Tax=Timema monikensis TaxID=170555 RepID=A0A7R9HRR8_9NEOP|nr:unnamed protein product [Timema monikensis]